MLPAFLLAHFPTCWYSSAMSNREQQLGKPKGAPLPDDLLRRFRAWVKARGEAAAVQEVGVQPETFARALAGLPVYPGTVALVRLAVRAAAEGGGA